MTEEVCCKVALRMEVSGERHQATGDRHKEGLKRVVVCGGGVIGAAVAYYLTHSSQQNFAVTIVERNAIAGCASGKAGGFLAVDWCSGAQGPLARKSFALHHELAQTHASAIQGPHSYGYRAVDTLSAAFDERRTSGPSNLTVPPWVDGACQKTSVLGTTRTTAQVHPRLFTEALVRSATSKGAAVHIGCVSGIRQDNDVVTGVKLENGDILDADVVVITMGPWSHMATEWFPSLPHVSSWKAHSVVIRPLQESVITAHTLFLQYKPSVGKMTDPEVYPRDDGTVYVCGASDHSAKLPADPTEVKPKEGACDTLRKVARTVSSHLDTLKEDGIAAKLEAEQACFLPVSPDGNPIIGRIPGVTGAYIATGHSVWGILLGPATGAALAELISTGTSKTINISAFDPARFVQ
eukprot:TRINITY_DN2480_c0_g1_i3.p1 TRINITY_DN2480_c0_g1~~TRINITY_DN2480_c0_g1_i3.p1  ORF type:complete len:409 (+),score=45.06 TRINITY_DN2480_c0_g1_i3:15-1241(+)